MTNDPWPDIIRNEWRTGMVVKGCVREVQGADVMVELEHGVTGVVRLDEFAGSDSVPAGRVVQPGQPIDVRITQLDTVAKRIAITLTKADRDDCGPA
jgi:ribosomal protein S1